MEKTEKREILWGAFAIGACGLLLLRSGEVAEGIREGLSLCVRIVVPSLFPFMALSVFICESPVAGFFARFLSPLTKVLRLPRSCGGILLAAAVGGYPSAAKCIGEAVIAGRLDRRSAARLLSFCVNAGAPFLVSAVGGAIFGSIKIGFILLASQFFSAAIIAVLGAFFAPKLDRPAPPAQTEYPCMSTCLTRSVIMAADASFRMCAFIVLFSGVLKTMFLSGTISSAAEFLSQFGGKELWNAVISGIFEVTAGCRAAGELFGFAGPVLAAALASFSGISVFFQVSGALEGSGVSMLPCILSRFAHAGISALLCRLMLELFPGAVETFSRINPAIEAAASASAPAVVSLLCMLSLFLLSLFPKNTRENITDIPKRHHKNSKKRIEYCRYI